jgi:hypothetical protein
MTAAAVLSLLIFAAPPTKVAVMPVKADEGTRAMLPGVLDDYLLTAAQKVGGFEVISQDDINVLLGLERQKELLGCEEVSCFAEIGGALGVDRIAAWEVSRVGAEWAVAGRLLDVRAATVVRRTAMAVEGDAQALLDAASTLARQVLLGEEPGAVSAVGPGQAFRSRLAEEDLQRYLLYREATPEPLQLDLWVAAQNDESTALLGAELGVTAALLASAITGVAAGKGTTTYDVSISAGAACMAALATLLIIDALDLGGVELLPSAP